jgi:pyruvate dehydrogenase (quinone)
MIDFNGARRLDKRSGVGSLNASGMPSALGLQKCQPGRQVICLAGDGGFTMLLGEFLTIMPEDLLIKIIVMTTASSVLSTSNRRLPVWCRRTRTRRIPTSAKLRRQCAFGDTGSLRQANSKGRLGVARAAKSSLLQVKVKPMQLVMPPSPLVSPEAVVGMAYMTRATCMVMRRWRWQIP